MPVSEPLPHFVDDLLGYLHETHPTYATLDGVHAHDDLLEDLSRAAIEAELTEERERAREREAALVARVEELEAELARAREEDLKLRGQGEILGTRQAGAPGFRLADPDAHRPLMELAAQDARAAVEADPDLAGPRGEALRVLLYLFGRDAAVRLLRAG